MQGQHKNRLTEILKMSKTEIQREGCRQKETDRQTARQTEKNRETSTDRQIYG